MAEEDVEHSVDAGGSHCDRMASQHSTDLEPSALERKLAFVLNLPHQVSRCIFEREKLF